MLFTFFNNDSEMEVQMGALRQPTPINTEQQESGLLLNGEEMAGGGDLILPLVSFVVMLLSLYNAFSANFGKKSWWRKLQVKAAENSPAQTPQLDRSRKYVLVTGCDRGLGYHTAKRLDTYGFSVIAGCLNTNDGNVRILKEESSDRLQTVKLDVTSRTDLDNVKNWMRENINGELWGVVNNAGVCFVGTPEIMAYDDVNHIVNVNLSGTLNVVKKFVPLIRQSRGRIVNVGSINGEVPMPFFSVYSASKAAVKMFTECLSYELKPWGVNVSLVAPAAFKTDIITYDREKVAEKWWNDADEMTQDDYGKEHFKMPMRKSARLIPSEDTTPFTDSILHALTANNPKHIYRVGQFSSIGPALIRFIPGPLRRYLCGYSFDFTAGQPIALQQKKRQE